MRCRGGEVHKRKETELGLTRKKPAAGTANGQEMQKTAGQEGSSRSTTIEGGANRHIGRMAS